MKMSIWPWMALALLALPLAAQAQIIPTGTAAGPADSSAQTTELESIVVLGAAPDSVRLDLGTGTYTITQQQIETIAQGENTSFNQILVHAPGVSDDTYGAIHFRNEDPYYRYYINGTLLPSGINGFAQDIDTRFVEAVTLKIGALPAYYPEGNYGIVDITTKSGPALSGGDLSIYGGSYSTLHPTISYGGTSHGTDYYFTGSFVRDDIGLENPINATTTIHDATNQYKGFAYVSHQFDAGGRLSLVFSGDDAGYQIPNTPGQVPAFDFGGTTHPPTFVNSTSLNETQNEQTYYGFVAYQQTVDDFSLQISQVDRLSTVKFNPDINGDLLYNGVAAQIKEYNLVNGAQGDFAYNFGSEHTVRFGVLAETTEAGANTNSFVYATDPAGDPVGALENVQDDHSIRAYDWAVYAQDEWRVTDKLTINYGLRFEQVKGYTDQSQMSPRLNAVYQFDQATAVHAGYARYFDPPQLLNISSTNISKFDNTTNAADQDTNDPIKVEKSHYFDVGVTHDFLPGLSASIDSYYKIAADQIDDGQFGAANISSPYNYGEASMYGVDFAVDYTKDNFSAYGNFSASDSWGKRIVSSQFEFDADELTAIQANPVRFDQQQFYTASVGASYQWMDTTFHADAIYGDGIRAGFVNENKLQPYYPVNLGVEHVFKFSKEALTLRFDVLNVFDQVYVLNDGTGIGEGAVKYGNRRGYYGGVTYSW